MTTDSNTYESIGPYPKAQVDRRSRLKRVLRAPSASLNTGKRLKWLMAETDNSARILDLGSGTRRLRPGVVNLDIGPFLNVNVIGDGATLPFADCCFDMVICQAVLEHVCEPEAVVAEIARVLRSGGCVYAEIPFMYGFHSAPQDYGRRTLTGMRYLFKDFQEQNCGVCVGPSSTVALVLREYPSLFVGKGAFRILATNLFGWLTFWIKYFDFLVVHHPQAHVIASGLFFEGRKA